MIHLITGGSGSGKSAYAEQWILQAKTQKKIYVATMKVFGDEERQKISRHQTLRAGKGFVTIECPAGIEQVKINSLRQEGQSCAVLLECMANLAANELFCSELEEEEPVFERIKKGILQISQQCDVFAVVSNEVFSDGIKYLPETMTYLRLLGRLNCWIAREADQVTEVVYGIPIKIKPSSLPQIKHCG